ncbi:unnamed protein product [Prunus armeniaca]|uniref:Uncharacterized protein n=1 Tax=Prunus armeniaca TaxID=36596 RepID=A0A6J5V5M7_PRUAR|nr:unnamed protein product [Prunus armeniaca]
MKVVAMRVSGGSVADEGRGHLHRLMMLSCIGSGIGGYVGGDGGATIVGVVVVVAALANGG